MGGHSAQDALCHRQGGAARAHQEYRARRRPARDTLQLPGARGIDTALWQNYGKRIADEQGISFEEWREQALAAVPLRTISTPDIANLALFLAGDESRTITGQSINCDAGAYMVG